MEFCKKWFSLLYKLPHRPPSCIDSAADKLPKDGIRRNILLLDHPKQLQSRQNGAQLVIPFDALRHRLEELCRQTGIVTSFQEKPVGEGDWINAGYFVCEPKVFDFLPEDADPIMFEREPLTDIVNAGEMHAFKHRGFWKPMDMLKDNLDLEKMWDSGHAPWKKW